MCLLAYHLLLTRNGLYSVPLPLKSAFLKYSTKVSRIGCTKDEIMQRPKLMPWPRRRMMSITSSWTTGICGLISMARLLKTLPSTPPARPCA